MTTLNVEIVTPEKVALSASGIESVVLPAADGEYGVLPGHSPALVGLAAGEIRLRTAAGTQHFAIGGGYADVQRDKVSVFAEGADLASDIDAEKARQELEKAKAALSVTKDIDPITLAAAEAAARYAAVRLRVAELRGSKGHRS